MRSHQTAEPEVISTEVVVRRRHRSKRERREIAEESLRPGASVAVIARRHGINANQVFNWRKLLREGRLEEPHAPAQLIPVRLSDVVEDQHRPVRCYSGSIQVELGRARIRIEGSVDPENLRVLLGHLGR